MTLSSRCRLDGRTSTAVIEEVLHVELSGRGGSLGGLAGIAYAMLTPLVPVTDDIVRTALELPLPALGANDRLHVATCRANGIDAILTADRGFEGIDGLRRIDPLDGDALATSPCEGQALLSRASRSQNGAPATQASR